MRKRHRYVTVIVNGDTGKTLAMVEHRNAAALSTFLMQQGHRWCKGVKVVVSDGSKAYKSAIDAHLGHARHVLDRFHVIRWFSAGLTAVRRDIQRRPEGSKPAFDPEVFRARSRSETRRHRSQTQTGPASSPLGRPPPPQSRLAGPPRAPRPLPRRGPPRRLTPCGSATSRPASCPSSTTSSTRHRWSDEILAWHHAGRASNGRIEGINNLLQVLRRSAHGFTNPINFEARGILVT